ncbi:uncharacterized protein BJ212DRAFT_868580 [Suillus subaureus]|uniref:DUF6535 domain-containing protein n=1 Tax=Suillus subaureus TaxID=48587 RepID=A0A9P7J6E1_9AGAM|nr:uncharacterized protein BJ212DRAFT_868580 [Suillus subaureus]KAG1805472.1 hypothetical protein BJ212DRAFT_868580 [Suillus subaureus]
MQPNPGDTTNVLLLYLIQTTVNGPNSVPDINTLSSSTGYSSSTVWVQTLAYASLAFSVLAAFGAVLGKQWLNSYKSVRGRGSLEERGIERQMKLDGVEYFRLQTVLRAFLVLLQISLLLFGLSLSARMWTQETTISSVIICTTAFGILFYAGTILVSVLRPDSPFQTPASELFVAIRQKFLSDKFTFTPSIFAKSSAIRWILETSTNPEIVKAAAAIVPCVQWPPNLDASAAFSRLQDNFKACQDREELYVKYGQAIAYLCIQSVKINLEPLESCWIASIPKIQSRFIRDAFMAGRAAYDQLKNTQETDTQLKHRASVRTALRTMLVHGCTRRRFSRPDDECLIWDSELCWCHSDEREPSCEEFDWLVDYLAYNAEHSTDDETQGDALLALSAMHGLGSSSKQQSYINSLIHCMQSTRPPRVRHAALRATCEAREELASISSALMPQGVDAQLLDELSRALLTAVRPYNDRTIRTGPDASLHLDRDSCYLRLIYTLTKNDEWCQRLTRDGHPDRCIFIADVVNCSSEFNLHLSVIFGRIKSSGVDLRLSVAEWRWRLLIAFTWSTWRISDAVDEIPAIVTATRLNLTALDDGPEGEWFVNIVTDVHKTLVELQQKQAHHVDRGIAQATIDAALSSLQGLHAELSLMVEQWNSSQRNDGASRS